MKTIDHDPNEHKKKLFFGLTPGEFGGAFAISCAVVIGGKGLPPIYFGDIVCLGVLILMFWWFSTAGNKTSAHEGASNSIAFRLGKLLNSIRRGLRRSA